MNVARGSVTAEGHVEFAGWRVPLGAGSPLRAHAGREVIVGIRPHDLALASPGAAPGLPRVRATVEVVERLGTETHVIFPVHASRAGDEGVLLAADSRALFTAVVDPRATVAAGSSVELVLDPDRLHAFDPVTERALDSAGIASPDGAPVSPPPAPLPTT
jgi:multiple sugar transport system ATP-binding protein